MHFGYNFFIMESNAFYMDDISLHGKYCILYNLSIFVSNRFYSFIFFLHFPHWFYYIFQLRIPILHSLYFLCFVVSFVFGKVFIYVYCKFQSLVYLNSVQSFFGPRFMYLYIFLLQVISFSTSFPSAGFLSLARIFFLLVLFLVFSFNPLHYKLLMFIQLGKA